MPNIERRRNTAYILIIKLSTIVGAMITLAIAVTAAVAKVL
ncbi:MAG: hypothetical protein AABY64_11730 [Bdellovibrionota bacterium]